MRILVTGGTGFVGSHLVEALLERGNEVTCLVRPTSNKRWLVNLPVKYAAGDPADKPFLKEAVRGQDYIYHVAGLIKAYSYEAYQKANVQLTADLVESAAEAGGSGLKRFIHLSSLAATGPAPDIAGVDEETDCRPHRPPESLPVELRRSIESAVVRERAHVQ